MNKYFPIVAIVLTVTAIILLWFAFRSKLTNLCKKQSGSSTDNNGSGDPAPLNTELLLKKGMYNSPEVSDLQTKLGGLTVDGDFGPKTEARLKEVKCVIQIKLKDYDSTVCPLGENPIETPQEDSKPWWYSLPYGYAIFGGNTGGGGGSW